MERLLDHINSPKDLHQVPRSDLPRLAREIRDVILDVVSRNGGHLASNLGAVELTIALHYVLDSPKDKIIWDVGHQTYTHKLLTGRRDAFATLRQRDGISGFLRPDESEHDVAVAGHGGTSISTALGFAEARDQMGEHHKVVAVIGDGSLSTGMAFEGLNNAGALKKDFIVVLNDNEMSISPNVGALSTYLSQLLTGKLYIRFRKDVEAFLRSIPGVGEQMRKMAKGAEESLKAFLTPGILFEVLGFKYVGPLKGHELYDLVDSFERVKELDCPTLIHVYTRKGKGYAPAERDPVRFHGIGPFDLETGRENKRTLIPTYTEVFGKTLATLARDNPKVVAITAAMPHGTGLAPFSAEFPERFYDVGMAEQHGVAFAAGLASQGLRPVVAIYSTFLQRAYDQIVHDVCIGNLPVAFALDRAGIVGEDGPTHQGCFDYSYLRSMPNMVVMAPKDENELQHMLLTAIEHQGPIALRYPRGSGIGVPLDTQLAPLAVGKGEVLVEGGDVAILAIGNMVPMAVAAAEALKADGIGATVVNARFVKPLDRPLVLALASQIGKIVTVEENVLQGGFGSAVLELLEQEGLKGTRVRRLGLPDRFIEHGSPATLREHYGLTDGAIRAHVKKFLEVPLQALARDTARR